MFLSLCCKKLEKLLYGLVWTDMLSSAEYDQFIIAKLSVNHRPGSHIWSGNQSCEPCQPCLLNYSNNADTIQDWVSVCCAQCPAFFSSSAYAPTLIHWPSRCSVSRFQMVVQAASPTGKPDAAVWTADWLIPLQTLAVTRPGSLLQCPLCALTFTTEQRTQPWLGKGMMIFLPSWGQIVGHPSFFTGNEQ